MVGISLNLNGESASVRSYIGLSSHAAIVFLPPPPGSFPPSCLPDPTPCPVPQKLGEPIKVRLRESIDRPAAIEALSATLQLCDKAVNAYRAGDERYAHLDTAEVEKVRLETAWVPFKIDFFRCRGLELMV